MKKYHNSIGKDYIGFINMQQTKSSRKMAEIQPLMQQIQNKYKNDPQTMQNKTMELYKKHNYKTTYINCVSYIFNFC